MGRVLRDLERHPGEPRAMVQVMQSKFLPSSQAGPTSQATRREAGAAVRAGAESVAESQELRSYAGADLGRGPEPTGIRAAKGPAVSITRSRSGLGKPPTRSQTRRTRVRASVRSVGHPARGKRKVMSQQKVVVHSPELLRVEIIIRGPNGLAPSKYVASEPAVAVEKVKRQCRKRNGKCHCRVLNNHRFWKLMDKKGMTVGALAKSLGLHISRIYQLTKQDPKRQARVRGVVAKGISEALGVPPSYLTVPYTESHVRHINR